MPALTTGTPTDAAFAAGDVILYTGTCTLQVAILKADGNPEPVGTVVRGGFFTFLVGATYRLTTSGGDCCKAGDYELFAKATEAVPADYETEVVCDTSTGTSWSRVLKIEADVVTVLQDWTDTGRPCVEPVTMTQEYCVTPTP